MSHSYLRKITNVYGDINVKNVPRETNKVLDIIINKEDKASIRLSNSYHCLTDNVKEVDGVLADKDNKVESLQISPYWDDDGITVLMNGDRTKLNSLYLSDNELPITESEYDEQSNTTIFTLPIITALTERQVLVLNKNEQPIATLQFNQTDINEKNEKSPHFILGSTELMEWQEQTVVTLAELVEWKGTAESQIVQMEQTLSDYNERMGTLEQVNINLASEMETLKADNQLNTVNIQALESKDRELESRIRQLESKG